MSRRRRTSLVGGIILVLLGAWLLAVQLVPGLDRLINIEFTWPWIIIAVGLLLFVFGLVVGEPGMAVPACIVTGIGGILYYQYATGDWASWSYAWTLIPGFVGVGSIIAGLLGDNRSRSIRDGLNLLVISAVLFLIFGSFLGGLNLLGNYWPVLLILLGVWLLLRPVFRKA
jgi:predicted membrane protein